MRETLSPETTIEPRNSISTDGGRNDRSRLVAATLDALETGLVVVDRRGDVVELNAAMRAVLKLEPQRSTFAFTSLWDDGECAVRTALRRAAGSSTWVPFTLTRRGAQIALRARAFTPEPDKINAVPHVLVVEDVERTTVFAAHNSLVEKLNAELGKNVRAKRALHDLLARERMLHRELVHRVKNNLTMLLSLVRLARRRTKNDEAKQTLTALEGRVLSVAAVHEILDARKSVDRAAADELVAALCETLTRSFTTKVTLTTELTAIVLSVDDAIPLGLILNEAVTNALKHAFPDDAAGRIHVRLSRDDGGIIELAVSDNGVGGGSADAGEGTGTQVIDALVSQLGGTLERVNGPTEAGDLHGLSVIVRFAPGPCSVDDETL